jgi:hypothetical protein
MGRGDQCTRRANGLGAGDRAVPDDQAGDLGFRQVLRQAVAVAISVPGTRTPGLTVPSASLRSTPAGATFIDFAVGNTGNARLRPAGTFELVDDAGHELARAAVQMDSLYAGTSTTVAVPLAVVLAVGHYTASLRLTDPATGTHADSGPQPIDVTVPLAPVPSSGTNQAPPAGAPDVLIVTGGLSLPKLGLVLALVLASAIAGVSMLAILGRRARRGRLPARPWAAGGCLAAGDAGRRPLPSCAQTARPPARITECHAVASPVAWLSVIHCPPLA